MLSVGKVIEAEIARLNTSLIGNDAFVRNVVIESTKMRKSFFLTFFIRYIAYVKVFYLKLVFITLFNTLHFFFIWFWYRSAYKKVVVNNILLS